MKKPKPSSVCMNSTENPISIILITSGSRGQRLLFRYPYQKHEEEHPNNPQQQHQQSPQQDRKYTLTEDLVNTVSFKNPYVLETDEASSSVNREDEIQIAEDFLPDGELFGFSDPLLATMLAPKLTLCDEKFELSIDHVKFVGFPVLVTHDDDKNEESGFEECLLVDDEQNALIEDVMIKMVHVVFAVRHNMDAHVIGHFQNISKMLGKALRHEEKRLRYLSSQRETMVAERDNAEKLPESEQNPHDLILRESPLAQDLVDIFNAMCTTGNIKVSINGWLNFSYCLPHKVHHSNGCNNIVDVNKFNKYIGRIKPYHTLLLTDESEREKENLIRLLPYDASPVLVRLINHSSHIKNFQTLCQDADISLPQIFQLVAHLVYWGQCTVIYPLAESNIYVISENACTEIDSKHAIDFVRSFPKQSLHTILARFSFPITLGEYRNPLANAKLQAEQTLIVKWLLKRGLLKQLHTYMWIMPNDSDLENETDSDKKEKFTFESKLHFLSPIEKLIFDSFSLTERRSLIKLSINIDKEDLCFFLNMSKYFRGDHHLEDIMYYENVPRSKLLTIIDKFRSMLITVQHEDTNTNRII